MATRGLGKGAVGDDDGAAEVRPKRRSWSAEQRRRIVAEAQAPGASVASVARLNDINANLVFKWIRHARAGWPERRRATRTGAQPDAVVVEIEPPAFVPVRIVETTKSTAPALLVRDLAAERAIDEPVRRRPSTARCDGRRVSQRGAIEIALPNGARIEVGADVEEASLRLVLSAVKTF